MSDFKSGTKIKLTNGDEITVKSKLGEGGQGAVYNVLYKNQEYALKWYLPTYLKNLKPNYKKFYKNLEQNVLSGSPSNAFLWQKAIAITGKHSNGFGYIMDLRPANFSEFTKFIKAREHFSSTEAVIRAAINVVEAFQALHRKGLSYQDLSPGNFFIDKTNGDVLICDNDNVAPYGENLGVGGTPGYMAPEVILGKEKPSTNTDLFSLSVILFELFFLSHPLEGANCCKHPCLTPAIERELYAENPVFVCSKTDRSNAPVRGTCSNLMNLWPVYPEFLQDAFQRAFGEGLKDCNKRLSEADWRKVLYRLLDEGVTCPRCKEINFASMNKDGIIGCTVNSCRKTYPVPFKAVVNGFEIYVDSGKVLTDYHVTYGCRDTVVGTFVESKKNPGVFGLKNDSTTIWNVEYPGKEPMTYEGGKVVTVIPDTVITIGNKKVVIEKTEVQAQA